MRKEFKEFEKSLKKKSSLGLDPKFQDEFKTNLSRVVAIEIATRVINELGWELKYRDFEQCNASTYNEDLGPHTHQLSIIYKDGQLSVLSKSTRGIWDNGRNSKFLRLFIYAFKVLERELETETINELHNSLTREENMEDYVLPESLPDPPRIKKRITSLFWFGIIIVSAMGGVLSGTIIRSLTHALILHELLWALLLSFLFVKLIKLTQVFNFDYTTWATYVISIATVFFSEFSEYIILSLEFQENFMFVDFINAKLDLGFKINNINTGMWGWLILWVAQPVLVGYLIRLFYVDRVLIYLANRVSMEVIEFVSYWSVKDVLEEKIRRELSSRGWSDKEQQDHAIRAYFATISLARSFKEI